MFCGLIAILHSQTSFLTHSVSPLHIFWLYTHSRTRRHHSVSLPRYHCEKSEPERNQQKLRSKNTEEKNSATCQWHNAAASFTAAPFTAASNTASFTTATPSFRSDNQTDELICIFLVFILHVQFLLWRDLIKLLVYLKISL